MAQTDDLTKVLSERFCNIDPSCIYPEGYPSDREIIYLGPGNRIIRKKDLNEHSDIRYGLCPNSSSCEWYTKSDRDCNQNRTYLIVNGSRTFSCYRPRNSNGEHQKS
jgi:hypothetical protein